MLVYRVAHSTIVASPQGCPLGPYKARVQPELDGRIRVELNEMAWAHTNPEHPSPNEDDITVNLNNVCGFASTATLREWFNGYLDLLYRGEFRVFAYDVPKRSVWPGHIQLMFDPREAILRGSWGIRTKVPAMRARWSRCPS